MQESIHLYIQCFTEATKKYFATLKRRSLLQTNNKLPDARNKQRRLSELVMNHLIAKLLEKEQQEQLKCAANSAVLALLNHPRRADLQRNLHPALRGQKCLTVIVTVVHVCLCIDINNILTEQSYY